MKKISILILALTLALSFKVSGQSADAKGENHSMDTTTVMPYKYPAEAMKKRIQGTVKIKMTFDSHCNVVKKEVVKSLGYGCDEEALIALTNMEKKIINAKGHKCKDGEVLIYPITFKLN